NAALVSRLPSASASEAPPNCDRCGAPSARCTGNATSVASVAPLRMKVRRFVMHTPCTRQTVRAHAVFYKRLSVRERVDGEVDAEADREVRGFLRVVVLVGALP